MGSVVSVLSRQCSLIRCFSYIYIQRISGSNELLLFVKSPEEFQKDCVSFNVCIFFYFFYNHSGLPPDWVPSTIPPSVTVTPWEGNRSCSLQTGPGYKKCWNAEQYGSHIPASVRGGHCIIRGHLCGQRLAAQFGGLVLNGNPAKRIHCECTLSMVW